MKRAILSLSLLVLLGVTFSPSHARRRVPTPPSALVGCAAIESLFPGIATGNTVADLDAFVSVASNISTWAADAWAYVPAAAQAANDAAYLDLQNGLKTAIAEAQAAVAGFTAVTGASTPNWPGLMAAVTSAVDALVAELASVGISFLGSYKVGTMAPTFAGRLAQLQAAQKTIHAFKAP